MGEARAHRLEEEAVKSSTGVGRGVRTAGAAPGLVEVLASVGHAGGAREALSQRASCHVHERQARRRVALHVHTLSKHL